jgi:hypothetical protein
VGGCTPELARQTIENYADLFREAQPMDFHVEVAQHPEGFLAVTFPDGFPVYDFINLIGWLNGSSETEGASEAVAWVTSPASGLRYSLQPNEKGWGDTVVGASSDGTAVEVYLPYIGMCEVSRPVSVLPEPDLSGLPFGSNQFFTVTLDLEASSWNPRLEFTHIKDAKWIRYHRERLK